MDPIKKLINDHRQYDAKQVWEKIRKYLLHKGLIPEELEAQGEFWSERIWHKVNGKGSRYSISIRAYFISKVYEIVAEKSFLDASWNDLIYKIIVIGEYCITIMYLENHLIDGKYGVINEASREKNRHEKKVIESKLQSFIENEVDLSIRPSVHSSVGLLFVLYERGNQLDKNYLTAEYYFNNNFTAIKPELMSDMGDIISMFGNNKNNGYSHPQEKGNLDFLHLYLNRSYLINGVFFKVFTDLLLKLYSNHKPTARAVTLFSQKFGIVQQLVNDNTDILPLSMNLKTSTKHELDTFSDLKRGMVTLPIYCHLMRSEALKTDDLIMRVLNDENEREKLNSPTEQLEVFKLLKKNKSISQAMSMVSVITRDYYQQTDYLFMGNDFFIEKMALLRDLMGIAYSNQGYQRIIKFKN